jgi:polyisoprenoid-binding protein YceI
MNTKRIAISALVALLTLGFAATVGAQEYTIDGGHSNAYFSVNHLGIGIFQGMFLKVEGKIVDGKSIDIAIPTDSVFTADKKRDGHLKGPDFFNAKQFPKMTFKSKSVKKSGDKYKVAGTLTIRGVSKDITVDATRIGGGKDPWGKDRIGYFVEFKINRLDYGVSYMPEGLGKEVTIRVAIEAVK